MENYEEKPPSFFIKMLQKKAISHWLTQLKLKTYEIFA
jgi:hypothetical protein